jgi:hypothetical protein
MRLALWPLVPLRTRLLRTVGAALIVFVALTGVGITAPADAPFTIAIRPALLNLGVDIEIKVWTMHLHFMWAALPEASSTKATGSGI